MRKKQRNVTITDETWGELLAYAVLSGGTASQLCEQVLSDYLAGKRPFYPPPPRQQPRIRTIYTTDTVWAAAMRQRVHDRRSISETLEGLLVQLLT